MYRREKRRAAALYLGGGAAIVVCLGVVALLIWSMAMRNSYRAMCLEINDVILSTPTERCSIGRGGEEYPVTQAALDYYNRFLLEDGTMAISRRPVPATDRTITLTLGDARLLITGTDRDTAINLRWITDGGEQSYTVRGGDGSFAQLSAYYVNLSHRAAP